MKKALIFSTCLAAAVSASASITYSDTALSGLTYAGNSGDAQYVAGTPGVAQLYTPNSGTAYADDSPAVFVQGPMGTLGSFSASFTLLSSTGPSGTTPYWNIQVSPAGDSSPSDVVNIISMGGSPLNGSSDIHAYNSDYSAAIGTWGMTLSALDSLSYEGVTIGSMTVDWAGVEIGDWDNSDSVIPASADIGSITVPDVTAVPEPSTIIAGVAMLLPFGASTLRILRKKCAA